MQLILGSQSPRRREILSYFTLPFTVETPHFVEELVPFEENPAAYAKAISEGKAASLTHRFPNATLLTADTVVYKEGAVYAKPATPDEAFAMLSILAGSWHSVFTAVTATKEGKLRSEVEETKVLFHPLSPQEIRRYHEAFHTLDKAGGYGIQEGGSVIIEKMEGCFYNVMGLPITALRKVLAHVGIDLWEHLR